MNRKVKNFNIISFKLLFSIFPLLLISGPFLSDLLVVILALYSIFYYYLNNDFFFLKKKLIFFFFIFYFYININSLFSYSPVISFSTSLPYIRMILFSIFAAYLLLKVENLKKIIFYSFLFSYLILFIDSIIQLKTGQNIFGYRINIEGRVASLFRDKLVMGSYVSRTLPVLIAITYLINLKQVSFLRALLLFLAACLVFFSTERIAMFYFVMTFLLYIILMPNKKQAFLYVATLVILFLVLNSFKPSTFARLVKQTQFQFNEKKGSLFSERHEMHFITAYRMFLEKKVLGHGIKSFRYLCNQEPYSTRDLLISNNRNYSPVDGYFYITEHLSYPKIIANYLLDSQILEFTKIYKNYEDARILNDEFKIKKYENDLNLFKKNNSIISFDVKLPFLEKKNSPSKVNKGDYTFATNEFENGCNTHPHSSHLQFLSELGLFGYVFLFVFFIYLTFLFLKKFVYILLKKEKNIKLNYNLYQVFIILGLIQHLFPIIPSGNIFNNWVSIFFYFNLAFLLNFQPYDKKF
jgi:O-antigen ligase